MASKGNVSLFERFLIIVFGLALVLIGSDYLSQKHGGLKSFVKNKVKSTKAMVNETEESINRARLGSPDEEHPHESNGQYILRTFSGWLNSFEDPKQKP